MRKPNWAFIQCLTIDISDRFMNGKDLREGAFDIFCNEPYRGTTRLRLAIQEMNKDLPRSRKHTIKCEKSRLLAFRLVEQGKIIV